MRAPVETGRAGAPAGQSVAAARNAGSPSPRATAARCRAAPPTQSRRRATSSPQSSSAAIGRARRRTAAPAGGGARALARAAERRGDRRAPPQDRGRQLARRAERAVVVDKQRVHPVAGGRERRPPERLAAKPRWIRALGLPPSEALDER